MHDVPLACLRYEYCIDDFIHRRGSQLDWGKWVREICRLGVGAWVLKLQTPSANMGQSDRTERRGECSGGYFAAVLKAPWPINRLFEFPPRRACHVSIREGLFLLPVRLLAAGGSHTSHLAAHCCLVPGRLSCTCVCVCTAMCVYACVQTRMANFMFSGYSFPRGER